MLRRQLHVRGAGPRERQRLLLLRMPYRQHARPGKRPDRPLRTDRRRGRPCGRTRTSTNASGADANAVAYAATTRHSASALHCPLQCQRRRQCRGRSECWRPFRTRASPEPACSSPTAGYESLAPRRARTTLACPKMCKMDQQSQGSPTKRHTLKKIISIGRLEATASADGDIERSSQLDHSKELDLKFLELYWSSFIGSVQKKRYRNKTDLYF